MNFDSFIPDLIVSFISILLPLSFQYFFTIKPLKKSNKELQEKLDTYSVDLIDRYIRIFEDEMADLRADILRSKKRREYAINDLDINTQHYETEMDITNSDLKHARARLEEITKEIINFVDSHKSSK